MIQGCVHTPSISLVSDATVPGLTSPIVELLFQTLRNSLESRPVARILLPAVLNQAEKVTWYVSGWKCRAMATFYGRNQLGGSVEFILVRLFTSAHLEQDHGEAEEKDGTRATFNIRRLSLNSSVSKL